MNEETSERGAASERMVCREVGGSFRPDRQTIEYAPPSDMADHAASQRCSWISAGKIEYIAVCDYSGEHEMYARWVVRRWW